MSPGGVDLRAVRPGDEDFLYRVYASTRADEMALLDWDAAQKQVFLRMQFAAQQRHYREQFPDARFDVIERAGESIGRLYVDRRPEEIRIVDIALLPEHRRKRIGEALLRAILEEAAATGRTVSIHVERNNPALRLYQRLGFASTRDEGIYLLMRWDQEKIAS
jgi:ribosomal protein S18 acetylase RimI-like enzyme